MQYLVELIDIKVYKYFFFHHRWKELIFDSLRRAENKTKESADKSALFSRMSYSQKLDTYICIYILIAKQIHSQNVSKNEHYKHFKH